MPHRDAALQQKGADLIDDAGALPDQSFAHAMQRLQVELVGALGRDELLSSGAALLRRSRPHRCAPTQASMPIRHGGRLASRASSWPRDHFCRSTILPRRSWPTRWKEFLPISMPITAISLLSFSDMACSLSSLPPSPASFAGGAGARPDYPINGRLEKRT
jgi:hypothetical protein